MYGCYDISLLQGIGMLQLKDKRWTIFQGSERGDGVQLFYEHIAFCDRALYVGTFETFDLSPQSVFKLTAATCTMKLADGDHLVTLKLLPDVSNFVVREPEIRETKYSDNLGTDVEGYHCTYLINSSNNSDELLIVQKYMDRLFLRKDEDDDEDDGDSSHPQYYKTNKIEVFKLSRDKDDASGTFFGISRLESLGDGVLFLATGGSCFLSTSARDGLSGIRGNCIYFADDIAYGPEDCNPYVSRETGVLYLDNGRIQRPFPSVQVPRQSQMCWFIPNVWC